FAEREQAMKELDGFGERARGPLEAAAKMPPSPEAERRLRQLLGKLDAPVRERVRPLIDQMGAPLFQDRQRALRELEPLGPKALKQPQAAARRPDPEVARRAQVLLGKLRKK